MKKGDRIEWLHEQRGGYGYCQWVPGVVLRAGPRRVTIYAYLRAGGVKKVVVTPARLRPRAYTHDHEMFPPPAPPTDDDSPAPAG